MVGVFTSVGRSYMDNITFRGQCMSNKTLKLATTHQTLYNMTNCHNYIQIPLLFWCMLGVLVYFWAEIAIFSFDQKLIVTALRAHTINFVLAWL